MSDRSEREALVALLSLPELGPARLRVLLDGYDGSAAAVWTAVERGRLPPLDLRVGIERRAALVAGWRASATTLDPARYWAAHEAVGVRILLPADADWPDVLTRDPDPPPVLFVRGDSGLLSADSVAVVGTRRCTATGARVARRLGTDLTAAGLAVVSGLAAGIDAAAHQGALEGGGRPVGIVGTGLDRVYPARNRRLWQQVADAGVLASEYGLGVGPERWRFPARNRLVAAVSRAVVVVESRPSGGSMSTVTAALERQREVFAVPGSVASPASTGTNALIVDGALVARDALDVLVGIGHVPLPAAGGPGEAGPLAAGGDHPGGPARSGPAATSAARAAVLDCLGDMPCPLEDVVEVTGLPLQAVVTVLAGLEAEGLVRRRGPGYRRW